MDSSNSYQNTELTEEIYRDGMSIGELLQVLKNRFWWIVLTFVVIVGLAFGYLSYITPLYESEVTILVESLQKGSDFESLILGQSGAKIATEIELILSRNNIESALSKLDLSSYHTADGQPYTENGALGNVKAKANVSTVKDTNIVRIKVTDQDYFFARDFANALAESYNELLGSIARNNKTVQKEFIQSQLPQYERQLQESALALGQFREESNIIQLSDKSKLLSSKIAYFQLRIEPLNLQLKEADFIIENYQKELNSTLFSFISYDELIVKPKIVKLTETLRERSREQILYESIQEGINDNSDRMFVLQSEINQTSMALLDETVNAVVSFGSLTDPLTLYATNQLAKAYHQKMLTTSTIETLLSIEASYTLELAKLPPLERQLLELERDVQVYETLRMRLMELLEEVKIAEAAVGGTVTIVDPAVITYRNDGSPNPVSPNKKLILAVALLLGIALGVLLALVIEVLDSTIKEENVLRRIVGSDKAILGWVPLMKYNQKIPIASLVVYNEPLSFESERYKLIANNISFGALKNRGKIVGVTSASIGEGKSTVVANVATSLAMNGHKVLIIEGDLRLPQLESFFNLQVSKKGLVDSVLKEVGVEEVLLQPLKEVPLLHLLGPGRIPPLPSAIFSSPNYIEVLDHLNTIYEYIFIDTPPLIFASELMTIAQHIDGIVINVRAGITTKQSLRELLDNLELAKIPIFGIVFNGVIESKMGGYYSGGRYYAYRGYDYAKKYYGNKNKNNKKKSHTSSVRGSYRKAFTKDLRIRDKRRERGSQKAIRPFVDLSDPFKNEKTVSKIDIDEKDTLKAIESDKRARGKVVDKDLS